MNGTNENETSGPFQIRVGDRSSEVHLLKRRRRKRLIVASIAAATGLIALSGILRFIRPLVTNSLSLPPAPASISEAHVNSSPTSHDLASPPSERSGNQDNVQQNAVLSDQDLAAMISAALTQLESNQFDAAGQTLAAGKKLSLSNAQVEMIDGIELLTHYAEEFAKGFDQGEQRITPNMEIMVDQKPILIRHITDAEISFRSQGRNITVSRGKLPPEIRMAIADLWFDPQDPDVALAKAAFYAVGKHRDLDQLKHWCQLASQLGQAEDAAKLLHIGDQLQQQ